MTEHRAVLQEPRRRNLAILAGVAFIAVALAALGLMRQASQTASHETAQALFPDLDDEARNIAHVRVQTAKNTVDIVFRPEKGWVVASHDDYPASFDTLRRTVQGLITLTTIERKTARRDWLPYVDLDSPEKGGRGTLVEVMDEHDHVLAALITGKTIDIGDPNGASGLFVRRPGDPQSFLARSYFTPQSDPAAWLDKTTLSIDRMRIAEADVNPLSGPSYVVRRDNVMAQDFTVVDLPKGRAVSYAGAPDVVGAALVDFSFDDVKPSHDFDFSDPAHLGRVVTKTFDNLVVTVSVLPQGADYWATVSADGTSPDARREARTIDARVTGWAYKLPAYKGQQFLTPLENLLKPVGGATQSH